MLPICEAKKPQRNWRTFELLSTNQNKASCQSEPIRVEQSWRSIWSVKHSNRISVYNNKEGLRILVFLRGFLLRISTDFLENGWRLLHSVSICCFSWCVLLNLPLLLFWGQNTDDQSRRSFRAISERKEKIEIRRQMNTLVYFQAKICFKISCCFVEALIFYHWAYVDRSDKQILRLDVPSDLSVYSRPGFPTELYRLDWGDLSQIRAK